MGTHRRVLIANRGEIAIRIAKAAAALGMESVAVHPDADALSLHTRAATLSHRLENADPVAAYLDVEAIVAAAVQHGCDCLHPGYGFLSENPRLADACRDAGIAFVGPPSTALSLFGDKVRARALAHSLGIPVVSGSPHALTSADEALELAAAVGYPVMLKAAAGGGGRASDTPRVSGSR